MTPEGRRTEFSRVLLNRLLVLLGVDQIRRGNVSRADLALTECRTRCGELRVVGDILPAIARHATCELSRALVTPLEECEIISPASQSQPRRIQEGEASAEWAKDIATYVLRKPVSNSGATVGSADRMCTKPRDEGCWT